MANAIARLSNALAPCRRGEDSPVNDLKELLGVALADSHGRPPVSSSTRR